MLPDAFLGKLQCSTAAIPAFLNHYQDGFLLQASMCLVSLKTCVTIFMGSTGHKPAASNTLGSPNLTHKGNLQTPCQDEAGEASRAPLPEEQRGRLARLGGVGHVGHQHIVHKSKACACRPHGQHRPLDLPLPILVGVQTRGTWRHVQSL